MGWPHPKRCTGLEISSPFLEAKITSDKSLKLFLSIRGTTPPIGKISAFVLEAISAAFVLKSK